MSSDSGSADDELEKILVSYIKDFGVVKSYYDSNPSKLNDAIEHFNRVLSLPPKEVKLITIKLHLELRSKSLDPVDFLCSPSWTILVTKYKICEKFPKYDVKDLFVLYGKSIAKDWMYLRNCGIDQNGDSLYVYICNPQSHTITQRQKRFQEIASATHNVESPTSSSNPTFVNLETPAPTETSASNIMTYPPIMPEATDSGSYGSLWTCKICTFLNENWRKECVMCNSPFPGSGVDIPGPGTILPSVFTDIGDFEATIVGWKCPLCTFINEPTRPGCEICAGQRPADYKVPEGYELSESEKERVHKESSAEDEARQLHSFERRQNYSQHLSAENTDIIQSTEPVECMICFTEVQPEESIVLRECLHKFCKDCVIAHINTSEDATVSCPYMDDDYKCNNTITHREIKALLSKEDFKKFLDRGLMQAEKESANSFHCKTPDCHGWCVYEDLVNTFDCPVCKKSNCILCKAIHEGKNCKEYQDEVMKKAATDHGAKKTKELLDKMLKSGDALNCPKCNIIIQKKVGCDWIRCSMCKEEICWVTKGPRWGPDGPGDTSAGCRCRAGGNPCHPNCKNCH